MKHLVKITKVVEEQYIIEVDDGGSPADNQQAIIMAVEYAKMSDHQIRGHRTAIGSRVHGSLITLKINDIKVEELT